MSESSTSAAAAVAGEIVEASASRTVTIRTVPRRARALGRERRRMGFLMVLPALILLLWWTGIPSVATVVLAFSDYDVLGGTISFAGFSNFIEIFSDPIWNASIWHTVVYTIFTVPVAMAIAVVIAVLLNNKLRGRAWFRAAFFLPHITATVAIALVWRWMFEPQIGLFNAALDIFGIHGPAWLKDPRWALPSVILVSVWKGIGLKMLIYLAALQGIPSEVYEAADVDGASGIRKFFAITLPLLRPATFFVFLTSTIDAFQVFEQVYVLTPDGGPANATTVMTLEIYRSAFGSFDMSRASAQSVILLAMLMAMTLISRRINRKDEDAQV